MNTSMNIKLGNKNLNTKLLSVLMTMKVTKNIASTSIIRQYLHRFIVYNTVTVILKQKYGLDNNPNKEK